MKHTIVVENECMNIKALEVGRGRPVKIERNRKLASIIGKSIL